MIASILSTAMLFTATEAKAQPTTAPAVHLDQKPRPWAVKAVSDQIVNMCCWGYMWNGAGNGGGGVSVAATPIAPAFSTISLSLDNTDVGTDTATTIITTVPGGVVTIYSDLPPDSTVTDDTTDSTVTGDLAAAAAATAIPAGNNNLRKGFIQEFRAVESWAHNLAEAIVAPASMTALFEGMFNEVLEHGYIHPTKAAQFVAQASGAVKQLETDPAYKNQRHNLKANPTPAHFNIRKAIASATATHAAGIARITSAPNGKDVYHNAKNLAEHFYKEFIAH